MHKNEFIRQIAKESGLPQTIVAQVLGGAVRVVARSLIAGQKVVWTGFGTFEMRTRSKRQGINPQTRQRIVIGATQTPGLFACVTVRPSPSRPVRDTLAVYRGPRVAVDSGGAGYGVRLAAKPCASSLGDSAAAATSGPHP